MRKLFDRSLLFPFSWRLFYCYDLAEVDTGVFWDLDRCPVPVNLTPASIYDNIKLSLGNFGYTGTMSIVAYSSKKLKNEEDFESANIKLLQPG